MQEALDAVKFCLQAQAQLMRVPWPAGLNAAIEPSGGSDVSAMGATSSLPSASDPSGPASGGGAEGSVSGSDGTKRLSLGERIFGRGASLLGAAPAQRDTTSSSGAAPDGGGAASQHGNTNTSDFGAPPDIAAPGAANTSKASKFSILGWAGNSAALLGGRSGQQPGTAPALFEGLRVRMGVATGVLPAGSMLAGSEVMEMAKGESMGLGSGEWQRLPGMGDSL